MMGYIFAIFGLSVIIAIHELGHLIFAKRAGMNVERFGIGMGPPIFCIERGGTKYCLCWIPIGGFCQIKGEDIESKDEDSFNSKPPFQRFLVAFSGPLANFVTAFLLLVFLFSTVGQQIGLKIANLEPSHPAIEAGLMENDILKGINGHLTENTYEIIDEINHSPNQEIMLHVQRDQKILDVSMVPIETERDGKIIGIIGIKMAPVYQRIAFFSSVILSLNTMGNFFKEMLLFIGRLITGKLDENVEVVGPLGIIGIAAESASISWSAFLFFIAFLSLNLGMLNLFPIPPLDGGKILFTFWEAITKKPVNKKLEIWVNTAGFVLLISLILFVTFKDILGFF